MIRGAQVGPGRPRGVSPADSTWARLEDQIGWYDRKSGQAQQAFKWLKLATLALAAGLPR